MSEQTHARPAAASKSNGWALKFDWERWAPRTLMARASLIIVVPMILVQVISTYIFYDNHWDTMSRRMAASLAGDVASLAAFIKDFPGDDHVAWLTDNAKRNLMMDIRFDRGVRLDTTTNEARPSVNGVFGESDVPDDILDEALWEALKRPFYVDLATFRVDKQISIHVQLDNGVLHVLAPRRRLFSSTTYVFVIWMVGSSMLLFGVATVFLRNQVQTVRRLARAADEFGKGRDVPDFPAEGAFEVRQAARAFNIMRGRITRQIAQRTDMLSGVSHDLRTPLTRMKLQLEMMGRNATPEDIAALKDDAADMEKMLDAYLTFARGEGNEEAVPTSIADLLETIVSRFRRDGAAVALNLGPLPASTPLRPVAFERCLNNLIGNAIRYGKTVDISAAVAARILEIHVDDDGPGIPAENREDVFRPFTRLETSRNPKTGGVGLGLTIALDIVRSMGGEISLNDSPKGGLRASIRIPL
jgi:two-component system osmolarity sensor histidine kinase EnvZ